MKVIILCVLFLCEILTFGLPVNLGTFDLKLDDTIGPFLVSSLSYLPGPGPLNCREQWIHNHNWYTHTLLTILNWCALCTSRFTCDLN